MGIDFDGFDDLQDDLEELQENAEAIDGENQVPPGDLFPPEFMEANTEFGSFEEMLEESPWQVDDWDDFEAIPEAEFDEYVDETTDFDTWEEMVGADGSKWISSQLGL